MFAKTFINPVAVTSYEQAHTGARWRNDQVILSTTDYVDVGYCHYNQLHTYVTISAREFASAETSNANLIYDCAISEAS